MYAKPASLTFASVSRKRVGFITWLLRSFSLGLGLYEMRDFLSSIFTCCCLSTSGLPSQLRDAVLSYADLADNSHGSTRESDVSRDYKIQEYLKNNNEDTDRSESDNRILKLARAITQNREQHRVVVGAPSSSSSTFNGTQNSIDSSRYSTAESIFA